MSAPDTLPQERPSELSIGPWRFPHDDQDLEAAREAASGAATLIDLLSASHALREWREDSDDPASCTAPLSGWQEDGLRRALATCIDAINHHLERIADRERDA